MTAATIRIDRRLAQEHQPALWRQLAMEAHILAHHRGHVRIAAHDLSFLARHPRIAAWRASIALNARGPGAARTVEVWMKPHAALTPIA
ncbi:hypothetical protein [Caulobacter sp.]|uniref:hypothetical protein n=1 Tax=Caulobacter sp. TaxID=78 RepID=UPI001B2D6762|nr:hypothetical protein [Caulobacter sp.]MBO9547280.1 hypothetical protein [Caulobacter sp.]